MADRSPLHSPSSSRSSSFSSSYRPLHHRTRRRRRFSLRRIDKFICSLAKYFPLLLVYGGTTWAAYTEAWSICFKRMGGTTGTVLGTLGVALYVLANWSYTIAVFRDPGSPLDNTKHAYSHLPTTEGAASASSITVKSDGQERFCKKCQFRKPDRAHHCSTCNRCILKMDHHCPWLATCLGLYNYKAFLLFLIYTSLLCVLSFFVSTSYVYSTVFNVPGGSSQFEDGSELTPVNWVLLATVSGIVGLVLSGFSAWHLMLVGSGMTTIESLEKVRYSTPGLQLRNNGQFIFPPRHHTGGDPNAAAEWYRRQENLQAHHSYNIYLEEEANSKLPHAFDLGRKRNFLDVFGRRKFAWFFPLRMTAEEEVITDGWRWDTSQAWREGVEKLKKEREARLAEQLQREQEQFRGSNQNYINNYNSNYNTPTLVDPSNPPHQSRPVPVRKHVARAEPSRNLPETEDNSANQDFDDADLAFDSDDESDTDLEAALRTGPKDYYHRELYKSSTNSAHPPPSGPNTKSAKILGMGAGKGGVMGKVPPKKNYGMSKADQILGRSRYDLDDRDEEDFEFESVRLKRLDPSRAGTRAGAGRGRGGGAVPLLVAAAAVNPQLRGLDSNMLDGSGFPAPGIRDPMTNGASSTTANKTTPPTQPAPPPEHKLVSVASDDWSKWGDYDDEGEVQGATEQQPQKQTASSKKPPTRTTAVTMPNTMIANKADTAIPLTVNATAATVIASATLPLPSIPPPPPVQVVTSAAPPLPPPSQISTDVKAEEEEEESEEEDDEDEEEDDEDEDDEDDEDEDGDDDDDDDDDSGVD